jgi:hypothetical protein
MGNIARLRKTGVGYESKGTGWDCPDFTDSGLERIIGVRGHVLTLDNPWPPR